MPKLTYTTPPLSLMRELQEVANDAAALANELARANRLPADFPAEQLHELLAELQTLRDGTAEGCRQPLEYARARLPAIRRQFIQTEDQSRQPREDAEAPPPLTRGMTIDVRLGALVNSVTTALDEYRALASVEEDDAADTSPSAALDPNAPDIAAAMTSARRAETTIAEGLDELAAMARPGSANADNLQRQMRDTRGLLSLARIELRMPAFVPRWYRKTIDTISDYPRILRGTATLIQVGVDIARPLSDGWHKFQHGSLTAILDGVEHAATGLKDVARKWEVDRTTPPPDPQPATAPPDFSNQAAEDLIRGGQALPLSWRPFITHLGFGRYGWPENGTQDVATERKDFARQIDRRLVTGLPGLQRLALVGMQVTDLSPLAGLPALRVLYLNGTKVTARARRAFIAERKRCGLPQALRD